MTYQEALEIRHSHYPEEIPIREIHETDDYWYLSHSLLGSMGVVIEKTDGHVVHLGSGLKLDEWLYACRHGFRHGEYILRITAVHSADATVRILGAEMRYDYEYLRSLMATPPFDLPFSWRQYPFLSLLKITPHFHSEFIVTGCEVENCGALGSRICLRG